MNKFLAISLCVLLTGCLTEVYRKDFMPVNALGVYNARGIVDINKGAIVCWVKFLQRPIKEEYLIFSTDDNRLALSVNTFEPGYVRIRARALGNRRFADNPQASEGNYPEVFLIINNSINNIVLPGVNSKWYANAQFGEGTWHLLAMSWQGYPEGKVKLYLDAKLIAEKHYDSQYDDKRALFNGFVIGEIPTWSKYKKEMFSQESTPEPEPGIKMDIDHEIEIRDFRIYQSAVRSEDLEKILVKARKNKGFSPDFSD